MDQEYLRDRLRQGGGFVVVAELTGGPGFSFGPIEGFLRARADAVSGGSSPIPAAFDFAGICLPQNPGGVANIEPAGVIDFLQREDLLAGLDVVPHLSCKDLNGDALVSSLRGFEKRGVRSILALTGDKPVTAKGVFELEALGLLRLIGRINHIPKPR